MGTLRLTTEILENAFIDVYFHPTVIFWDSCLALGIGPGKEQAEKKSMPWNNLKFGRIQIESLQPR